MCACVNQPQELTLNPGFESLGLRVSPQTNKGHLNYRRAIQFEIYKHQSGPHRSGLLNLRALFEYQDGNFPRSIDLFQKSLKLDPENLNALAGLEYVYREVMHSRKASEYRERLEQSRENKSCQARCFFEQGYMIAFDVFVENKLDKEGLTGLQAHAYYLEALKMVQRKDADIEIREQLEWCWFIAHNLVHIIKTEMIIQRHGKIEKKRLYNLAIRLFHAVTFIEDDNYKAQAWLYIAHLLGSKCIKHVSSSAGLHNNATALEADSQKKFSENVPHKHDKFPKKKQQRDTNSTSRKAKANEIKTVQGMRQQSKIDKIQMEDIVFLEDYCKKLHEGNPKPPIEQQVQISKRDGEHQEHYSQSSAGKTGQCHQQHPRKGMAESKRSRQKHSAITPTPVLQELGLAPCFQNSDEYCVYIIGLYEKAKNLAPSSTGILNRYANFLWKIGKEEEAMEQHEESIEIDRTESNWFAFRSMGGNLRKKFKDEWYDKMHQKSTLHPRTDLAMRAKEKLEIAVKLNPNPTDYAHLAEIYHFLGINIQRVVTDERMLMKALYYFKYAMANLEGENFPDLHQMLGRCLLDLGEERNALECFKNAVQLQEPYSRYAISFRCMIEVISKIYMRAEKKGDKMTGGTAMLELQHWFVEGCHPKKYIVKELMKEIAVLWERMGEVLIDLCTQLKKDAKSNEQKAASLLEKGLIASIEKQKRSTQSGEGANILLQLKEHLKKLNGQSITSAVQQEVESDGDAGVSKLEQFRQTQQSTHTKAAAPQEVSMEHPVNSKDSHDFVKFENISTQRAGSEASKEKKDSKSSTGEADVDTCIQQEDMDNCTQQGDMDNCTQQGDMDNCIQQEDTSLSLTHTDTCPGALGSQADTPVMKIDTHSPRTTTCSSETADSPESRLNGTAQDFEAEIPKTEGVFKALCEISLPRKPPKEMKGKQVPRLDDHPIAYTQEVKREKNLTGKENDFYVVYCDDDSRFVSFHLLTMLENTKQLKGCMRDRDFMPGQLYLDCITNAMQNSSKAIVIISHAAVKNSYWRYEVHLAMMEYFKRGNETCQSSKSPSSFVIPILCENEAGELPNVPDVLRLFASMKVPLTKKDCRWDHLEKAILDEE